MAQGSHHKPFYESSAPINGKKPFLEQVTKTAKQNLIVMHINVKSLRHKVNEIESFIADKDVDILCITEHWLKEEEIKVLYFQNYKVAAYSTRHQCTGGGAVILVRNHLETSLEIVNSSRNVDKCIEYCSVYLPHSNLYVLAFYRSPSGHFDTFLIAVEEILAEIRSKVNIIIAGDFNVHFNTNQAEATRFCDSMVSYGLKQTIYEPTRLDNCLDNVFVSSDMDVCSVSVADVNLTDHKSQVVVCMIPITDGRFTQSQKVCRPLTQRGLNKFHNIVDSLSWDFIGGNSDVNKCFEHLTTLLENAYQQAFPEKTYTVRSDHSPAVEWFSDDLKMMREHLNFLGELKRQYTLIGIDHEIKKYKKLYQDAIKKAKIRANDNLISSSKNPSKTMWQIINKHRGKSGGTDDHENKPTPNDFNNFFSHIAQNIVLGIPVSDNDPLEYLSGSTLPATSFSFSEVSFNEVRDVIDSLKNKHSRDIFGLNIKLIKTVKNCIIIPLTKLINLCFQQNTFPEVLKTAVVVPIFKKGDPSMPDNYRPISLLPIISKILEKCMAIRIVNFFETNGLFARCQFGFREHKNTVLGIINLVSDIIEAFQNKEYSTVLLCDLSKAFDCVDHAILLQKLKYYNFNSDSIQLVESYLRCRCQVVRVAGVTSAKSVINIGVPQGSVLGPIIFLIYINDLPNGETHAKFTLFADDTTISHAADTCEGSLNGSMVAQERAENWFCSNRLLLNADKTSRIIFSMRNLSGVENASEVSFLGVTLDPGLQWGKHINALAGKLCRGLYVLRNLHKCVSPDVLRTAYFAIFHTHVSYAILAWGHSAEVHRVFGMQRKAVRVMSGLGYMDDCRNVYVRLGLLTVPCLYVLECLLYVRQNEGQYWAHEDIHDYNTRSRSNLVPTYWRLRRCQNGPGYWAIKFFNVLPENVKALPAKSFKHRVKRFLINSAFYSFEEYLNSDLSMM